VVVVCLSKQFNQAGFRQKEVRIALDAAMEKPDGEIFIIPARLEECDTLESLSKWHWVDLFDDDGLQRLMMALRIRADRIGATLRQRSIPRPKKDEQKAAREKAEKEAAEKARLEDEDLERQRLAKEKSDREAAEKLAREKAEQESAEKARLEVVELEKQKATKEQADREAADAARIARDKAEKDSAEKSRLEAEKAERRRLAREVAGKSDHEKVKESKPVAARQKPSPRTIAAIAGGIVVLVAIFGLPWKQWFAATPDIVTVTPTNTVTFTPVPPTPTKTPTQAFTPTATPYPTEITDNNVPMRLVPAGNFEMGSTNGGSDETPVHTVYLDAFYMDKYEVTNALYKL
jgi:formylglycine-generating enzyme required for sulfatase activity